MQHLAGLALVILQAVLLGLLSRTYVFPGLIILLASFGAWGKWRVSLSREQAFLLSAAAAFLFLLKHRFWPHEFQPGTEFIRTQVAFIIAQYLLAIEAAHFLVRHEGDHLSPVLPALGAVALICIADVQITSQSQRTMTRAFAVTYPALWALYLWACRRPLALSLPEDEAQHTRRRQAQKRRRVMSALVLLVAATTAWFSSQWLYQFEKRLEPWLVRLLTGGPDSAEVGFSRSSRLGSVSFRKSQAELEIALTVVSDSEPGYFRGAVFTIFDGGRWDARTPNRGTRITETSHVPPGMPPLQGDEKLFAYPLLHEGDETKWHCMECWVEGDELSPAFTPLGTTHLVTAGERVGILPFGQFVLFDIDESQPYTACVPEKSATYSMNPYFRERLLSVPESYQRSLKAIAQELFQSALTPREKMRAVETYFRENYQYRLGIEIPEGKDPLLYFLREKPPAHCEYFATAAALLLRTGGVPTRYVTGFVPAERNASGGYWVARNRDAHAWVEAYDAAQQKWTTVEATPSAGIPGPHASNSAWWEALKSDWWRFRTFVVQGRWRRGGSLLMSSRLLVPFLLLIAIFSVYLALRIRSRWPAKKPPPEAVAPAIQEMRNLLAQMDERLGRHGLRRRKGETLHQFAHRVSTWDRWNYAPKNHEPSAPLELLQFAERAAEWYRDYARSVYTGQWDQPTRQELQVRLPTLPPK